MEPKTADEHYRLAYELDCAAGDWREVEQHYQCALELDPTNPRYHANWVCYLQTRGRSQATRDAWTVAQKACPQAYGVLHFPVAQMALHHAQLDFADDVLLSVPVGERTDNLARLWDILQLMWLAQEEKLVLPNTLALDPHAWDHPHLSTPPEPFWGWGAGVITEIDVDKVVMQIGMVRVGETVPQYGCSVIKRSTFDRLCVEPFEPLEKQHVELVWLSEEQDCTIRAYPEDTTNYFALLAEPIFPDPVRYLRKAGWVQNVEDKNATP